MTTYYDYDKAGKTQASNIARYKTFKKKTGRPYRTLSIWNWIFSRVDFH